MASWTEQEIVHLMMRAAFSVTEKEAAAALALGKEATVKRLVQGKSLINVEESFPSATAVFKQSASLDATVYAQLSVGQLQWIFRMVQTPSPLHEKMTLFWHDHFATSAQKVKLPIAMITQNDLLRNYALGDFKELVKLVGRDAAMLIWLDANANQVGKPNENYARELMELFTLGIGNYMEKDVKEVARAFTGWRVDGKTGKVAFSLKLHDIGTKSILGETGRFNDEQTVDVLFRQSVLAEFIVKKLLQHFATLTPAETWVKRLAARLRQRYRISDVMTDLFLSDEFWDPNLRQKLVKTPADYVVWITRSFDRTIQNRLTNDLKKMGQDLYYPPDVNGWPMGEAWLNSSNLLARYQFAEMIAAAAVKEKKYPATLEKPTAATLTAVHQWIDAWLRFLRITPVSKTTREALLNFVETSGGAVAARANNTILRGLIHLMLVSPEAQLK